MTQATTTTLGEIKLAGDLAGSNDALLPTLTATAVTPGTYVVPTITVDSKGRLTSAVASSTASITALIPDGSASTKGLVSVPSANGLSVASGVINMALATTSTRGTASFDPANFIVTSGSVSLNSSLAIPVATDTVVGGVKTGTNITNVAGLISIPTATGAVLGVVRSGANLTNTAGTLSVETATGSVFGVVRSGANLTNTAGVLSVADATSVVKGVASFGAGFTVTGGNVVINTATLPAASASVFGTIKGGGAFVTITGGVVDAVVGSDIDFGVVKSGANITNTSGVLSVADATSVVKGVASFGAGFTVTGGNVVINTATLPAATGAAFGFVKSGTNITNTAGVFSVADATAVVKGVASFNSTYFSVASGAVTLTTANLPVATGAVFGIVRSGTNITNAAGVLSVPDASSITKGVASFSTGLLVSAGAVTVDAASLPAATSTVFGFVKAGTAGTGIANSGGTLSAVTATGAVPGVVQTGANVTNAAGVISIADATTAVKGVASFNSAHFSVSSGAVSLLNAASYAFIGNQNTWTKAQSTSISVLTPGATVTPDFSLSNVFTLTAGQNFTLSNPTNVVPGTTYMIMITQDGTGSRLITWGSRYKFAAGAVKILSTSPGKTDIISVLALSTTSLLVTTQIGF